MEYNILNNYIYENKSYFLTNCDWFSNPLRVALGGRTIQIPSRREQQDHRICAIALCCLVIPVILGAVSLLLKHISQEAVLINRINTEYVNHSSSPTSTALVLLSDQPFVPLYFPSLPALTYHKEPLGETFLNHLFEEFNEKQPSKPIDILPDQDGELYVHEGRTRRALREVIERIDWRNIGDKCKPLKEKTLSYLQKSLFFERLRDPSVKMASLFHDSYPFIRLYTSKGLYAVVNSLLRKGQLQSGQLAYASKKTNDQIARNDPHVISKIIKEVLFISLMLTGSLCDLPDRYLAQEKVTRIAHIPRAVLDMMNEGQIIAERGFLSASAAGGGFAGGGPCDESSVRVRFTIISKNGKRVGEFSDLPENEVLFIPFSQFKIIKRTGDELSGFKIEMEEV